MPENYGKACKEVLVVLKSNPDELYKLVPRKFLELLFEAADNEYEFELDPTKGLDEQDFMPETTSILSAMNKFFFTNYEKSF